MVLAFQTPKGQSCCLLYTARCRQICFRRWVRQRFFPTAVSTEISLGQGADLPGETWLHMGTRMCFRVRVYPYLPKSIIWGNHKIWRFRFKTAEWKRMAWKSTEQESCWTSLRGRNSWLWSQSEIMDSSLKDFIPRQVTTRQMAPNQRRKAPQPLNFRYWRVTALNCQVCQTRQRISNRVRSWGFRTQNNRQTWAKASKANIAFKYGHTPKRRRRVQTGVRDMCAKLLRVCMMRRRDIIL